MAAIWISQIAQGYALNIRLILILEHHKDV